MMHLSEENEKHSPKAIKSAINPNFLSRQKKEFKLEDYVRGILSGNRVVLGRAITLVESNKQIHQKLAQEIIEACLPHAQKSFRIGITGTPGVGKSTFIESFGQYLIEQDNQLAILAVDPSSQLSKGSIMGDKTRMQELSVRPEVFIRPSPAGDSLGGVARKTRETIILCEAAGFNIILVETVGVGQSEISVHSMVDFFLLLLLPGAGDELQGIKRGIVEMADLLVVNKADGDRKNLAKRAQRAYKNALHLFPPKLSNWPAQVLTCSALQKEGLSEVWNNIQQYRKFTLENDYFSINRQKQASYWLEETLNYSLKILFLGNPNVRKALSKIQKQVETGKISPFKAAEDLLEIYKQTL